MWLTEYCDAAGSHFCPASTLSGTAWLEEREGNAQGEDEGYHEVEMERAG